MTKEYKQEMKLPNPKRTQAQNRALHLYFTWIAKALNDAGLDIRAVLKPEIEIPWNGRSVKEHLWRPVQQLQLGKRSTTELTTSDIDIIYETLNRHIAKFGIHTEFPSLESLMEKLSTENDFVEPERLV